MVFIYRQEILKDISLFTSQPKAKFYDELLINLDLNCIPARNAKTGRTGFSNHAMICAFIVMKCEGFSQISDLHDYLSNNLIIALEGIFVTVKSSFLIIYAFTLIL